MKISCLYIEAHLLDHPRVQSVRQRFKHLPMITCNHYGEIFNRKGQHFRLQKQAPALIIAEKKGQTVLPTPEGFGIGGSQNYYFSHLLNCPYDCRYCFLQGLYQSAHYVWFINYASFFEAIAKQIAQCSAPCYFFSGYDADSLAFEPVTGFIDAFVPFFQSHPNGLLELRSKSTNIRALLKHTPSDNIIVAFSLTPDIISAQLEHGVPSVQKRIAALATLSRAGWRIGLRFDPLIDHPQFESHYAHLVKAVFAQINTDSLHSVSIGPLRFPHKMHDTIFSLYPKEPALIKGLTKRGKQVSYRHQREQAMHDFMENTLRHHVSQQQLFRCQPL